MKATEMNEEYILIDREERPGKNGVCFWRLTFQRISDNLIVEMTVDATYRNFRRRGWDHVVESDQPWGVYNKLKLTERTTQHGTPVVSADSAAEIIYRCADHAEALLLAQASINHNSPSDRFNNLFD
jgi:hypothetical protein